MSSFINPIKKKTGKRTQHLRKAVCAYVTTGDLNVYGLRKLFLFKDESSWGISNIIISNVSYNKDIIIIILNIIYKIFI